MTKENASEKTSITVTVEQAADLMQVSRPVMLRWTHREDFPCFRVGRKVLIVRRDLEEWAAQQARMGAVL